MNIDRGPGLPPPGPSKKTIYLANFHGYQFHGPGRQLLIVDDPFIDRTQYGIVDVLTPEKQLWKNYLAGAVPWQTFRAKYIAELSSIPIHHGSLFARFPDGSKTIVDDGDTLLCVCSKAKADDMRCHRAWAAHLLKQCNWRVMIDGRQLR